MGIALQIVESRGFLVPDVQLLVARRIQPAVAKKEFPVIFDAPEVLQSPVGIAGAHVINGMTNAKDTLALHPCLPIE